MTGTSGRAALAFVMPGILMSDRNQNKRHANCISDALKRYVAGLGKVHRKATQAKITTELLAKQHLDVRLIIHHEYKKVHETPPD